jgi:hypothetical protein
VDPLAAVGQPEGERRPVQVHPASLPLPGVLRLERAELLLPVPVPGRHRVAVESVGVERLPDADGRCPQRQPGPQVPIGQQGQGRIEAAGVDDEAPLGHHARRPTRHDVRGEERNRQIGDRRGRLVPEHPELRVDDHRPVEGPSGAGLGHEGVDLAGELVGGPEVVVVQEGHPPAGGGVDAGVAGGGHPPSPGVADDAEPVVAHGAEQGGRLVGGGVVHRDDLQLREPLGQDRAQRAGQEAGPVAGGYDHRDQRRHTARSARRDSSMRRTGPEDYLAERTNCRVPSPP